MALIKCPECGNEISDKAQQCIHCGYPIPKSNEKIIITTSKAPCPKCGANWHIIEGDNDVCKACGHIFGKEQIIQRKPTSSTQSLPHCPKCNSTSITAGQRGYKLMTGFLGSNKTVNRCANCGHSWSPGKR